MLDVSNQEKKFTTTSHTMSTKRGKGALLQWCQKVTQDRGIEVKDLSKSFADGLAFAAIIDSVG